jgi:hypothetical protein
MNVQNGEKETIRFAFMTDKVRVLGASIDQGNRKRLAVLSQGLGAEMKKIIAAENIAVG